MPFIKSRNPTPFRAYGSTPTSYSATINYSRGRKIIQEGGQCYKCTKLLFVCIISLVAPPIVIGWFLWMHVVPLLEETGLSTSLKSAIMFVALKLIAWKRYLYMKPLLDTKKILQWNQRFHKLDFLWSLLFWKNVF